MLSEREVGILLSQAKILPFRAFRMRNLASPGYE